MSETKVLHVTLPAALARLVEAKVASGEYENESQVVASGLEALGAEDEAPAGERQAVERWLREEVVPTVQAIRSGHERLLSTDEAKRRIEAHIARRRDDIEDHR